MTQEASTIIPITSEEAFQDALKKDLCLVDFWAPWCGPCRALSPALEDLAKDISFPIYSVDIDALPSLATDHQVMSIPTLILFKKGSAVATRLGSAQKEELALWIEQEK